MEPVQLRAVTELPLEPVQPRAVTELPPAPVQPGAVTAVPPAPKRVAPTRVAIDDDEYATYLASVDDIDQDTLRVTGTIDGHRAIMLLDSGATKNFITTTFVQCHGLRLQRSGRALVVRIANGALQSASQLQPLVFQLNGCSDSELVFYVTELKQDVDVVLGIPWFTRFNPAIDWVKRAVTFTHKGVQHSIKALAEHGTASLVTLCSAQAMAEELARGEQAYLLVIREHKPDVPPASPSASVEFQAQLQGLRDEFKDIFADLPDGPQLNRDVTHAIDLEPGKAPPNSPPYRLSKPEMDELKKQIDELLAKGYIRPSTSPYGAPVLFVKKKSGELRMCIDYRKLNAITIKNSYPMPRVDDLLDQLAGSTVFSTVDLRSAYFHVPIKPGDEHKTAFRTQFGHYEFLVLSFGLCNAPATFQRLMADAFRQHIGKTCCVFFDDLLLYTRTEADHVTLLRNVFQILRDNNLRAKLDKCSFMQPQVPFLGHIVSEQGITLDPSKVSAIKDWPPPNPTNPKAGRSQLLSFLGLANYYRRFVRDFSRITLPLTALLAESTPWTWDTPHQQAFDQLKAALTSQPVFIHSPDWDLPFVLETDASDFAIGAVLMQKSSDGKRIHVVAYSSHKLKPAEINYPAHEKEMLAVVTALKEWKHYLVGKPFLLYTDNKAVTHFLSQSTLNPRQARWLGDLSEFHISLIHKAGIQNVVADALSRRPDHAAAAQFSAMLSIRVTCARHTQLLETPAKLAAATPSASKLLPSDELKPQLLRDAIQDKRYQTILHQVQQGKRSDFVVVAELLYYTPMLDVPARLYVPAGGLRQTLLAEAHDTPTSGHLGREKMFELLSRDYYWPGLWSTVYDWVTQCHVCQRNKSRTAKPPGRLHPLPIPDHCWEQVSHDLVTGLPTTDQGHDSIAVFVDRLSKYIVLAPTVKSVDAPDYARLFFDNVYRRFGLPKVLVSDRDPRFTSHFWQSLFNQLGTKLSFSTAFHPQTDGQTERANRTVEDMLRAFVSANQRDWSLYLSAVEFAYNNSVQASSGFSPFYLLFGRHPHNPLTHLATSIPSPTSTRAHLAPAAQDLHQRTREALHQAKLNLRAAQERQKAVYDKNRPMQRFAVGDKVLLSTLNLSLPEGTTPKLSPRFIGPFPVSEVISPLAYRLKLPPTMKCHDVFHVCLLRALRKSDTFPDRYQPPPPAVTVSNGEAYYEVEAIRGHKPRSATSHDQVRTYLVKWTGYPEWDNTEEPAGNIQSDAPTIVAAYWQSPPVSPESKVPSKVHQPAPPAATRRSTRPRAPVPR